jgi:hypothetical protein
MKNMANAHVITVHVASASPTQHTIPLTDVDYLISSKIVFILVVLDLNSGHHTC